MKVLVTGGAGSVGRAVVAHLLARGYGVRVIGRRPTTALTGVDYRSCDICDYAELRRQAAGVQAIVHLAALPHPYAGPAQQILQINCQGTMNVYQAAVEEGIERVVSASSINAFGYNFGIVPFELQYFPIDEQHPTFTTDPYSFSKQILEATAAYFWRRDGVSGACLRLPWVYTLDDGESDRLRDIFRKTRAAFEQLLALAPEDRGSEVAAIRRAIETQRATRRTRPPERPPRHDHSPRLGHMASTVTNFWASIDARDAAAAIEQSLTVPYEGSHVLFVNDTCNSVALDSEQLLRTFFPEVPHRTRALRGTDCCVAVDRARQLLNFEPRHSVRDWLVA